MFKKNTPFRPSISEINNTLIDYAEDFDTVMPMYNLRDEIDVNNNPSESK